MSGRAPRVTADQVLRVLLRSGWFIDRQSGSHVHLMNSAKPGHRVTVPRYSGTVVKPKTLKSILTQAGIGVDEFRRLL
jgi:predicted RNA binding protein YcfA (HicA-like mRNA interferase family)